MTNDESLEALLKKAQAHYDGLSVEEKLAHRREQAISWVFGQVNLSRPEGTPISREEVERIVDRKIADGSFRLRP